MDTRTVPHSIAWDCSPWAQGLYKKLYLFPAMFAEVVRPWTAYDPFLEQRMNTHSITGEAHKHKLHTVHTHTHTHTGEAHKHKLYNVCKHINIKIRNKTHYTT